MNAKEARERALKSKREVDKREVDKLINKIFTTINQISSEGSFNLIQHLIGFEYDVCNIVIRKLIDLGYVVEYCGTDSYPQSHMKITW